MKTYRIMILIGLLMQTTVGIVQAQTLIEKAKVVDAFGTAKRRSADNAPWQNINVGDLLPTQATVQTGDNSAVLLQLPDTHVLRIGAGTTVKLQQLGKDKQFSFSVLSGHIWSFVRRAEKPAKYEIETPSAVIGVSGTIFSVSHDPTTADTEVSTNKGEVKVTQGGKTQAVAAGYALHARRGMGLVAAGLQTVAQRRIWQTLHTRESWVAGAGSGRLDRQVEQTYGPFKRAVQKPVRDGANRPLQRIPRRQRDL